MKVHELKSLLQANPQAEPRFILPDGQLIPAHFHVTEVGHVAKHFIDCGGNTRQAESCVLQLWVNDSDRDHRLGAAKFAFILELGGRVLPNDDLEVEVEYEDSAISQFPIQSCAVTARTLEFTLATKHTDCLAREKCGVGEDSCGCGTVEPEAAEAACC